MPDDEHSEDKTPALRTRAEEALGREQFDERQISDLSPEEIERLLHELRVHQIELEMQNEELRRAQLALEESRDRYIDLYDFAPVGYLTLNDKGIILGANLTAARLLDTERRVLISKPFSLFLCEEERGKYYLYLKTLLDSKVSNACETRLQKKDGATAYVQLDGIAIRDSQGCLSQYHITITDITERKKAEEELQRECDQARQYLDISGVMMVALDVQGNITLINRKGCEILGYLEEEIINRNWFDVFVPSEIRDGVKRVFLKLMAGDVAPVEYYENPVLRKDGEQRIIAFHNTILSDRSSRIVGILSSGEDVTERKLSQNLVRARLALLEYSGTHSLEQLLQKTLDEIGGLTGSPIGFYHFVSEDEKTIYLQMWSTRTIKEFCTAEGKAEHYPVDRAGVWIDTIRQRRPVIHNDYASLPHRKGMPEGHAALIRELVVPIMRSDRIVAVLGIGNKPTDYTEQDVEIVSYLADVAWEVVLRKRAEESVTAERQRLYDILETMPVMVCLLTPDYHVAFANRSFREKFGEDNGRHCFDYCFGQKEPCEFCEAYNVLKTGKPHSWEATAPDGTIIAAYDLPFTDIDGSPLILEMDIDVTEQKRSQEALRQSEERFQVIAEALTEILWMADEETGAVFYASPAYERVWGRSLASLYENPRSFIDAIHEEDRGRVAAAYKHKSTGQPFQEEYRIVRPDGEIRWILDRGFPVRDENGKVSRYVGIAQDITERKNSEEALQKSEALLNSIIEQSPFSMFITDNEGTLIKINPACKKWVRVTDEDVVGKYNLLKDEAIEAQGLRSKVQSVFENGEQASFELEWDSTRIKHLGHKEAFKLNLYVTIFPVKDAEGRVTNAVCQHIDITDRKRAEEELRTAEKRYRSLVEGSFDGIFLQKGPKVVFANSRLCELLGYERSELEGMDHWLIYYPDYQDIARYRAQARMRGEVVPSQYEVMLQRKDGSSFHGELLTRAVEVSGEPGVQVWVRDITARREAEHELRRSEERYRTLYEESKDGIFLTTDDGRVVDVNQSFLDMLGYTREELLRLNISEVYADPADRDKYRRVIKVAGSVKDYPITFKRKDRKEIHCLETASLRRGPDGSITGYQGIIRDVTEQEHLLEQLLQAQKMEAVGTLAGGVAHDFNNILQIALGYSQLILGDDSLPQRYKPDLQKINESARRGSDLVQRLLTFSRKTPSNPQPISVNQRIREIGKMLERTIPKMIDIQLILDEDLAAINADPTQVDQVLMNLALNARDAMPEGGKLIIETANILLDEEYARKHLDAEPGHYVLLMVTDAGSGMDKDTLEHIFEPFYTTKEAGQGTGLGLAVVHGIVQQHGGFIRCYSEPGAGTTFKIYFPALISEEKSEQEVAGVFPRGGSETILVADDDEMVREFCSRILTRAGYTVISASSGKEALELYGTRGHIISLVILDLIMPEMSGKQCLELLLNLDPSVKVVIASGYSADGPTKDALSAGATGFINKPYEIRQVLEIVRQVLDAE